MLRTFIIFILLIFFPFPAAAAGECDYSNRKPIKIYYNVHIPEPEIDNSMTVAQMTAQNRGDVAAWRRNNSLKTSWFAKMFGTQETTMGGQTSYQHLIKHSVKINNNSVGKNQFDTYYCPQVESITLNFNYWGTIAIPSEYKKGSCAFDVIFNHEMEHYVIGAENMHELSKWLRDGLPELAYELEKRAGRVSRSGLSVTRSYFRQHLRDTINASLQDTKKETKRENQLIDRPEEYAVVQAKLDACQDG